MLKLEKRKKILLFLLLVLGVATRFCKLDWGEGFFFHPDELNMSWGVEKMRENGLDPQFYAYGQLPLFLAFFSREVSVFFSQTIDKVNWSPVLFLRFWSAFFGVVTLILGFKLAKKLFGDTTSGLVYLVLLIFTPGLIQMSHFGTTEAILSFSLLAITYVALVLYECGPKPGLILAGSFISGLAIGSKISAVLFLTPFLVVFLFGLSGKKRRWQWFFSGVSFLLLTLVMSCLFSPFHVLKWREALSSLKYETAVATGEANVFYTRQFNRTTPVLFQLIKIFPWTLGLSLFFLFLWALGSNLPGLISKIRQGKKGKFWPKFLIVSSGYSVWFFFNAFLFAKWTRFVTPVLPIMVLVVTQPLRQLFFLKKKRVIAVVLLMLCVLPGVIFTKLYFATDVRLVASDWMNKKISRDEFVLQEAGNIVNLPLAGGADYKIENFDFYDLDTNPERQKSLREYLPLADYVLLPSRRVFANHQRLPDIFPQTALFYDRLFAPDSDFEKIAEFKTFSGWEEVLLGSDLSSEETWTVFDHPTIRIYKRRAKP